MRFQIALLIGICFIFFVQCNKNNSRESNHVSEKRLPRVSSQKIIPSPVISYHLLPVNKETIEWLRSIKLDDTLNVLFALNRIDRQHLFSQDSLVVPDTFFTDLKKYSPFPLNIDMIKEIHKLIFFSYRMEAFAAYENGTLKRWGPVSMGKRSTPTPTGLFHTNWKSEQTISTVNEEWIMNWYFNLDNFLGMSMHEYDLPGYPASHACVRLLDDDAYFLYHWANQWVLANDTTIAAYGTPVIIYGKYSFGKRKPWRALDENNEVIRISSDEIMNEVNKFFPVILEHQTQRDSLVAKKS